MKLKKILTGVSACAIAVSAMALSASAAITNADDDKKEAKKLDCMALDVASIVGIKAEITVDGDITATGGFGGAMVFDADNKAGTGWTQFEWGIDGTGKATDKTDKAVKIEGSDKKYTITYMGTTPYLAEGNTWNNAVITGWWGADFTVNSLTVLDKDGNEVKAGGAKTTAASTTAAETTGTTAASSDAAASTSGEASTSASAATTKAATTKAAATTAKKADATKAGDAGVGLAIAGLAGGAAAMFIARKKH